MDDPSQKKDEARKYSKLFVFSGGNKAGMETMDKEKQAQIIYEMSKNSAFFQRAMKLDQETETKALTLKVKFDSIDKQINLQSKLQQMKQARLTELEQRRNFDKICCVLDMDMFYAAVEIRDQPHLKELPVAVGGNSMISTSNYVARKFGVRAAMPGFIAKKLCPNLIFIPCNFQKYEAVAEQLRNIIREYDPHFHSHSLDEVYFDLTNASIQRINVNNPNNGTINCNIDDEESNIHDHDHHYDIFQLREIANNILQEIRTKIFQVTNGLTSSAGMANNFMLAKVCADVNKPNGQFELLPTRQDVLQFLSTLPTRKIGGIGKSTEKTLEILGMKTMGDVKDNIHKILHTFSAIQADFLIHAALGIGKDEQQASSNNNQLAMNSDSNLSIGRKSIGCERTYSAKGISNYNELEDKLHDICVHLHQDMIKEQLKGQLLTLKVKDIQFNLHSKCIPCHSLQFPYIQSLESIEKLATTLLVQFKDCKVRLLGVIVSKFIDDSDGTNKGKSSLLEAMFTRIKATQQANVCTNSSVVHETIDLLNNGSDEDDHLDQDHNSSYPSINDEFDQAIDITRVDIEVGRTIKRQKVDIDTSSQLQEVVALEYVCPVCSTTHKTLIQLNDHLDRCISNNRSITSTVAATSKSYTQKNEKKQFNSITKYFH